MSRAKDKIHDIQYDYIKAHFEVIDVHAGNGFFNLQCHQNAVQHAKNNNQDKIAMAFYLDENDNIIIHFLNYEKKKFVDNTLGHRSQNNVYYFVKWCPADYVVAFAAHIAMRRYMKRILPWYLRKNKHART